MTGIGRVTRRAWMAAAAVLLIQLVPYGRQHRNPPATRAVAWDTPATARLAQRGCFDCHSNETRWPWYASVAPVSWRVQHDVDEGRDHLNFSALDTDTEERTDAVREAARTVRQGEMPPRSYLITHPAARLTAAERQTLARGLERSLAPYGAHEPIARRDRAEDEDGR
ncbi:MAG TPA: heme-binding domain-containing protein [Candidatus Eisenbacteria bacterium]|nr:heme-binding domain-containing protein [Candidatus Eisenbacteria bacterium]